MATGEVAYDPSIGGTTPPVVIDGTGLTTTVPLLIKNGKSLSGLELQVTGTAATGVLFRDSAGVAQWAVGYAVSAGEWSATAAAGDLAIVGPTAKALRVGRMTTGGAVLTIDLATSTLSMNGIFAFANGGSLTSCPAQVNGDANTGLSQPGGADTISLIAGGVEALRMDATGKPRFGLAVIALGGGIPPVVGTIGGSGPATAAQNSWGKVNFAGTDYFIPLWV